MESYQLESESDSQTADILQDYEFIKLIGSGFFAQVKLYRNKTTKQQVAVKHLGKKKENINKDYLYRFKREIKLLRQLSGHPNIIEFIDEGTKDGRPFYIMPAAKSNLETHLLKNNTKLTLQDRVHIFEQILEAIVYAHSQSILHRDLSYHNVLVFSDDKNENIQIKVCDFGLGKNWSDDSGFSHSVNASRYGTSTYAAPEQLSKLQNASTASDVFSLGKLLDFILTGKNPYVINTKGGFRTLIERATQPEPEDRYQTVEELKLAFIKIKDLIVPDEKTHDSESDKFTQQDGSTDWTKFYRFAITGEYTSYVYSEYLEIVTEILLDVENVKQFISIAPDLGHEFVLKFIEKISELPSTGWPFEALNDFAVVLKNIYFLTKNDETKLLCLKRIWIFAYDQDRWRTQRLMQKIINENHIPEELQERFAVEILESSGKYLKPDDFQLDKIPGVIKKAIEKIKEK